MRGFLDGLLSHYVLDGGRLVVAHAGLPEYLQGRASGRVRSFALFGDTTGETDEGNVPVCIKDYATGENVIEKVDPVITERRFNSVPVRIIIDREGRVKHIHFLSAFPDQTKAITDALFRWKFRPYLRNGQPVEVETGIMFGIPAIPVAPPDNALRE